MTAIGFDDELPQDVYKFNEMRQKQTYTKSGVASMLKPAPVTQHLPGFDKDGVPLFRAYKGSGKLEGKYALITGKYIRERECVCCQKKPFVSVLTLFFIFYLKRR